MPKLIPSINIPKLSFLKPKDAIAVDIGTSSVKIVFLKASGNKYTLVKWGILPINENLSELPPQERKLNIIARIGEFFAKEKILIKNVITSISGHQVIVRYVNFPKLSREELNKTIVFEAEPYIPFDIKEVDLSYHILGDIVEEGHKKMEAILVACKKDVIASRLEIFNELNLRLIVVDIDAFALENAYEVNIDPSLQETVMLINIGSAVTNIAIVENNKSKVVRDIFIAGDSFTKIIQRNLGCEIKKAEELKFAHSILVTAEEKEKTLSENQKEALQVSQALSSMAKDFLTEIHRSIDFYISQNPDRTINKILLSGGSANLKNLDRLLNNDLKIAVEVFNPLKNITSGEAVPPEIAAQLAVATGLAVRHENDMNE
ncbi:MAG: type IV pilus assembly protein PilM [Elusimicrobia bacterium]|nr:type IV pilus assembly protein PilM [Candidatus Liberimonas magnetica]